MAVNHGGDSDSTGSLVGNIVGAWKGLEAIPARWLSQLELWDVVDDIAQDLYCYPAWTNGDDTVWNKYPGF